MIHEPKTATIMDIYVTTNAYSEDLMYTSVFALICLSNCWVPSSSIPRTILAVKCDGPARYYSTEVLAKDCARQLLQCIQASGPIGPALFVL